MLRALALYDVSALPDLGAAIHVPAVVMPIMDAQKLLRDTARLPPLSVSFLGCFGGGLVFILERALVSRRLNGSSLDGAKHATFRAMRMNPNEIRAASFLMVVFLYSVTTG